MGKNEENAMNKITTTIESPIEKRLKFLKEIITTKSKISVLRDEIKSVENELAVIDKVLQEKVLGKK